MVTPLNIWLLVVCWASSAAAFAITGIQAGVDARTGFRPLRYDISELQKSGEAWDLYILALQKYSQTNQSDPMSNYQVSGELAPRPYHVLQFTQAGIHGYPRAPWDGAVGNGSSPGYCTHSSILFPMWHRPYLLLYEQILWGHAQEIAAEYPPGERERYQKVALVLRIPYWDWAQKNSEMPDIVSQDQVTINTPQGPQTIPNPLNKYHFHPYVASDFGTDLPPYNSTVRMPDEAGLSRSAMINQNLKNLTWYLHDYCYKMISSTHEYQQFSNAAAPNTTYSIEAIHGSVHNLVGGMLPNMNGHMTLFPYSAFDPIFMLHHCNVDRLVAIWQAIYPDSFVVPQPNGEDTYMAIQGALEDVNTPLYPFRADKNGTFHTSASVRSLKPFGYAYPDVIDWTATSPADLSARTRRIVNHLWHPDWANASVAANDTSPSGPNGGPHRNARMSKGASLAASHEWNLRVDVQGSLPAAVQLTLYSPSSAPLASFMVDTSPSSPFAAPPRLVPLTTALLSTASHAPRLGPDPDLDFVKGIRWEASSRGVSSPHVGATKANAPAAQVTFELIGRPVSQPTRADDFPHYGEWAEHGKFKLADDGHLAPIT